MAVEYIKKEDVLNLDVSMYVSEGLSSTEAANMAIKNFKEFVKSIPAADVVERKNGEWIAVDPAYEYYKCSECRKGTTFDTKPHNFCPNCGADMRGDSNE